MVQRILDFLGMRAYYIVNIPATPLPSGTRNPGGFFMIPADSKRKPIMIPMNFESTRIESFIKELGEEELISIAW